MQSGAAANFCDRTYRQIWGPNVNNNIYYFWHINIHQLDLNSDSFSGSPNLENRKWKFAIMAPKSGDQENREKTPIIETKAAVNFLMSQGVLCLK